MIVRIDIRLKSAAAAHQGAAVQALQDLHTREYTQVTNVTTGKYIELDVPDTTPREEIEAMCRDFLAQRGVEEFEIKF